MIFSKKLHAWIFFLGLIMVNSGAISGVNETEENNRQAPIVPRASIDDKNYDAFYKQESSIKESIEIVRTLMHQLETRQNEERLEAGRLREENRRLALQSEENLRQAAKKILPTFEETTLKEEGRTLEEWERAFLTEEAECYLDTQLQILQIRSEELEETLTEKEKRVEEEIGKLKNDLEGKLVRLRELSEICSMSLNKLREGREELRELTEIKKNLLTIIAIRRSK